METPPVIDDEQWEAAHRQLGAVLQEVHQKHQDAALRPSCSLCRVLIRLTLTPKPRRVEELFQVTEDHNKCRNHAPVLPPNKVSNSYQIRLIKPAGQSFVYLHHDSGGRTAETMSSFAVPWEPLLLRGTQDIPYHIRQLPVSPIVIDREWIDIKHLEQWLSTCMKSHTDTCGKGGSAADSSAFPKLILVDTADMCLVEMNQDCRYVALSYVWGSKNTFLATTSNFGQLKQHQGLRQKHIKLPQTIEQAIALTSALGERYLWVDALCIVQDGADKADQLNAMASLYANATLTIVAGSGEHADAGFRGLQGISKPRRAEQQIAPISQHQYLVRPTSKHAWDDASLHPWSGRAWTFQEAMSSRRLLYFANNTVRWRCRTTLWSEESDAVNCVTAYAGVEEREPHLQSPHLKEHNLPILSEFEGLVNSYNTRKFTYAEDALVAFAGVATKLSDRFRGGFISGLPEMFFDLCLLWRPLRRTGNACKRRTSSLSATNTAILPSWSWAGWETEVTWPYTWNFSEDAAGPTPIVLGNIRPFYRIQPSYITADGSIVPINAAWFDEAAKILKQNSFSGWQSHSVDEEVRQDWGVTSEAVAFKHSSKSPAVRFCFPVPLSTSETPARNINLLSFETASGHFKLGETRKSVARIHTVDRARPAGTLWHHDDSDADFVHATAGPIENRPSIELIAILGCTTTKETDFMWEMPGMSLLEDFDDRDVLPRTEDIYNVMWVARMSDGTVSRKGTGIVQREIWEQESVNCVQVRLS